MKRPSQRLMRAWTGLFAFLTSQSLKGDFDGLYSVTPPAPGTYSGSEVSTNYGHWSVWRLQATVDTSNAPGRLILEVPAHSLYANGIRFMTRAAASGTVRFDGTTVSRYPGSISWVQQSGGPPPTYQSLDTGPAGVPKHFEFPVLAGDLIGFSLSSGGDVVSEGDPWLHTLIVENFVAPMPPLLTLQSPTVLRWQGVSNATYTVQGKTNLNSTDWVTVGIATSTGTEYSFTNAATSATQQFYRVICPP